MALASPDTTKGWELPICQSPVDAKENFQDLLSKLLRLHASLSARNSYLESELLRISANSIKQNDSGQLPVPEEWATSAEVRTLIGRLEKQPKGVSGELPIGVDPLLSPSIDYKRELAIETSRPCSPSNDHQSDSMSEQGFGKCQSNDSMLIHNATTQDKKESKLSVSSGISSVQFHVQGEDHETRDSERKKRQSQWRVAQGTTKDFKTIARVRVSMTGEPENWRDWLGWVLGTNYFIAVNSLVLFSYAIFVAIETEVLAQHPGERSSAFMIVHVIYSVIFTVELLMRLGAEGWGFFFGKSSLFNAFDTTLVVSNVVDLILAIWSASLSSVASAGPIMRTLRTMRLVRTIRLVRTFRHFHEFQKMAFAIASSFKTLLCSMLVVFFLMFFFAVVFTQGAADTGLRNRIMDLELRYGDFPATLYTLFLSVSNGISWGNAYTPLADINPWYGYAFIVYIVISLFGVLNVVTSIFVESVIRSAQIHREIIVQDKEKEKYVAVGHMQEVFRLVNRAGSGQVTSDEVEYFLSQPDLRKYMEALDVSPEDTRLLFRLLDRDGSGTIDLDEFCEGCMRLKGTARSIDMQTLIFQMKNFLSKWAEFTDFVQERFDQFTVSRSCSSHM